MITGTHPSSSPQKVQVKQQEQKWLPWWEEGWGEGEEGRGRGGEGRRGGGVGGGRGGGGGNQVNVVVGNKFAIGGGAMGSNRSIFFTTSCLLIANQTD